MKFTQNLCVSASRRETTFALTFILIAASPVQVHARNPEHLDEQFRTLSGYLEQGDLERGVVLLDLILEEFSPDALREIGPRFGRFVYLRGLFDLAAGDVEAAAVRFEASYRLYANQGPLAATRPNRFVDEALVRHISALMTLERSEEAAELFPRVNRSGLERMSDQWTLSVNQGLAMLQTGKEEEGIRYLRDILENRENPNITSSMRMEVVRLLALHWADKAPLEEVVAFAHRIRDVVQNATARDRRISNPAFYDLARNAYERGEPLRSALWLGIVDTGQAVLAAEAIGNPSPVSTEEQLLEGIFALTAGVQVKLGNPFGTLPALDALLTRFPEHPRMAEYRKNRTVTLISAGRIEEAVSEASSFREAFPDSPQAPEMEGLLLELLLSRGEWDAIRSLTEQILSRQGVDAATELAEFARGMVWYQEGSREEAARALEAYLTRFPDGSQRAEAFYYLAACRYQQTRLDDATGSLSHLIRQHPDSSLVPAARLLRAQIFSQNGQIPEAREDLRILLNAFPDSPEIPTASLLLGELMTTDPETDPAAATEVFETALGNAQAEGDRESVTEALRQLALLSVRTGDVELIAQRLERYLESSPADPLRTLEVLDAAWNPMNDAGKRNELIAHVEQLLLRQGTRRDSPSLSALVEGYQDLLEREPADLSPLETLARAPDTPGPLRASLLMARLDSLGVEEEALRTRLTQELAEIPREQTSTGVLVRLARRLEQQGDASAAAGIENYLQAHREGEPGYELVVLGIALVKADSDQEEVRAGALQELEQILPRLGNPEARERAHLGIARVHSRNQEWKRAEEAWGKVLANRDWVSARAEANFEYARAIEGTGDTRRALGYYVSVYSNFAGQTDWSTEAYLRAANLMDAQGKRKEALLILQDMLRRMHTVDHPNVERATHLFTQWRDEFVRSTQP